jgi:hypothetical protein
MRNFCFSKQQFKISKNLVVQDRTGNFATPNLTSLKVGFQENPLLL